jgi:hypothetical protein
MPDSWDPAAGFPAMTGNVPFLDVVRASRNDEQMNLLHERPPASRKLAGDFMLIPRRNE